MTSKVNSIQIDRLFVLNQLKLYGEVSHVVLLDDIYVFLCDQRIYYGKYFSLEVKLVTDQPILSICSINHKLCQILLLHENGDFSFMIFSNNRENNLIYDIIQEPLNIEGYVRYTFVDRVNIEYSPEFNLILIEDKLYISVIELFVTESFTFQANCIERLNNPSIYQFSTGYKIWATNLSCDIATVVDETSISITSIKFPNNDEESKQISILRVHTPHTTNISCLSSTIGKAEFALSGDIEGNLSLWFKQSKTLEWQLHSNQTVFQEKYSISCINIDGQNNRVFIGNSAGKLFIMHLMKKTFNLLVTQELSLFSTIHSPLSYITFDILNSENNPHLPPKKKKTPKYRVRAFSSICGEGIQCLVTDKIASIMRLCTETPKLGPQCSNVISSSAVSSEANLIAVSDNSNQIHIWDLSSGEFIFSVASPTNQITTMVFFDKYFQDQKKLLLFTGHHQGFIHEFCFQFDAIADQTHHEMSGAASQNPSLKPEQDHLNREFENDEQSIGSIESTDSLPVFDLLESVDPPDINIENSLASKADGSISEPSMQTTDFFSQTISLNSKNQTFSASYLTQNHPQSSTNRLLDTFYPTPMPVSHIFISQEGYYMVGIHLNKWLYLYSTTETKNKHYDATKTPQMNNKTVKPHPTYIKMMKLLTDEDDIYCNKEGVFSNIRSITLLNPIGNTQTQSVVDFSSTSVALTDRLMLVVQTSTKLRILHAIQAQYIYEIDLSQQLLLSKYSFKGTILWDGKTVKHNLPVNNSSSFLEESGILSTPYPPSNENLPEQFILGISSIDKDSGWVSFQDQYGFDLINFLDEKDDNQSQNSITQAYPFVQDRPGTASQDDGPSWDKIPLKISSFTTNHSPFVISWATNYLKIIRVQFQPESNSLMVIRGQDFQLSPSNPMNLSSRIKIVNAQSMKVSPWVRYHRALIVLSNGYLVCLHL